MIPALQRKHCRKEAYQANRGGMSVNGYITARPYIVLHAREFSAMLPYALSEYMIHAISPRLLSMEWIKDAGWCWMYSDHKHMVFQTCIS